jgi:ribosomal protein S18 acetylase RimI-like enzyme
MDYTIRPAQRADLPLLAPIEEAAGQAFAAIGMPQIAADPPPTLSWYRDRLEAGLLWVAVGADDAPVGYLAGEVVDGTAHVLQVTVAPTAARQGVGARLLGVFEQWAAAHGLSEMTLTTFVDVPWKPPTTNA